MWDWEGRQAFSQWKNFRVAPETDFYRLFVSDFEGGKNTITGKFDSVHSTSSYSIHCKFVAI
jgi:hypothetical protein